jgi:hypothetical protein
LHIGLHKTGTSWLQDVVIAHPGNRLTALGAPLEPRRDIVWPHPYHFDAAAVRQKYARLLAEIAARGGIATISDERLSGNPLSGGYDTGLLVDRLAMIFDGASVLLVLREQKAQLLSIYDQYVRTGGACSIEDFLNPRTRHVIPSFRAEYLMFDRLVAHLHDRFGREQVLVLPYERLRADPEGFQRAIFAFAGDADAQPAPAGVHVNAGRSAAFLALQRRLNPLAVRDDSNAYSPLAIPRLAWPLHRITTAAARLAPAGLDRAIEQRIRAAIATFCAGRFEASNRATSELTGLDLKALGYAM